MRHHPVVAVSLLSALALVVTAPGAGAGAGPPAAAASQSVRSYVVVLEHDAAPGRASQRLAVQHGAVVGHVYRSALKGYSARMSPAAAASLAKSDAVRFVQPDRVVTATAQRTPTGVNRADADRSPTARINGVNERVDADVAVLDTGVDLDHGDLNVRTAGATDCVDGVSADDGNGHGTHVAGTIAAMDNGRGVVGMSPGARIWPVRVLNEFGSGSLASVVCGIDYVTAHADEIEVANLSLTGSGSDDGDCGASNNDAMHAAICRSVAAGVTYVVAAGNSRAPSADFVPAAYDEVITVSALADFDGRPGSRGAASCRPEADDGFASFSNYGGDVDVIAPGVCIRSTWRGGGYLTISGTSMASPHVAGAAALISVSRPSLRPAGVRALLRQTGTQRWSSGNDPDSTKEPLLNARTH
jgi:subtilisin